MQLDYGLCMIRRKRIYNFFLFHACLVSTLLCFVHTLRCFHMFSGTNLLTSCHSASCMFSSVFGSRKAENQYSRNWTGQKPKSIFYCGQQEARIRDRGGSPGGHTPWQRSLGLGTPGGAAALVAPLPCLFAYKVPQMPK